MMIADGMIRIVDLATFALEGHGEPGSTSADAYWQAAGGAIERAAVEPLRASDDARLFVLEDPEAAARLALALVHETQPDLWFGRYPRVRAGLHFGGFAVSHGIPPARHDPPRTTGGDLELAAQFVCLARCGEILVSGDGAARISAAGDFELEDRGRHVFADVDPRERSVLALRSRFRDRLDAARLEVER